MRLQCPMIGLTVGMLMCLGGAGCAVSQSVAVHRPGMRSETAAPERLLASAQVFEKQGHLSRAESMYRRVLTQDPSSARARQGMQQIAALNRSRQFDATPGMQPRLIPKSNPETRLALDNDRTSRHAVVEYQSPVAEEPVQPTVSVSSKSPQIAVQESSSVPPVPPEEPESTIAGLLAMSPASPVVIPVQELASAGRPEGSQLVSLEELKQVGASIDEEATAATDEHTETLLRVLRDSGDPERRAVAASLLGDAPASDARVDAILNEHSTTDEPLVAAAACESLLARGLVSDEMIGALLSLSEDTDAEIRRQASASLRRLAGTPWEDDAIQASLLRLDDSSPAVRGMAALTLSEFGNRSELILQRLVERYDLETDESALASLEMAAERLASSAVQEGVPLPFAE